MVDLSLVYDEDEEIKDSKAENQNIDKNGDIIQDRMIVKNPSGEDVEIDVALDVV